MKEMASTTVKKGKPSMSTFKVSVSPNLTPDDYLAIAVRCVEGRWHEAEPFILECVECSVRYAKHVVKGRWPEAEALIRGYKKQAIEYGGLFCHQFDEKAAALCPYWAYRYAKDVVKGKLPPQLHKKMQLWAMSDEHKGNRYLQCYLTSKKYQ
jgi:hypothetical protein